MDNRRVTESKKTSEGSKEIYNSREKNRKKRGKKKENG